MAKTQLRAIKEIATGVKKLRGELDKTKTSIVSISAEARKAKANFQFTGPKQLNTELAKNESAVKKLNEALRKQAEVNKKLQTQINKLTQVRKKNINLTLSERESKRQLTQQLRTQIRASDQLSSAYSRQSAKLILLRNRYKDLATRQLMGTKLTAKEIREKRRLLVQIQKLDRGLKKVDRTVGQSQRNVGNYGMALKGLGGTLRNLAGAFGIIGGVMIFAQLMRNGIRTIIDYGKANATLSGVLQLQQSEMKELIEDSKRLGAITVKTANEVVGLQIAYARLGFSQQQILELTEATIEGSIAMNAELSETANLTGAIVNSMAEFSAIDAPLVMDIMALATAKSALTFEKLQNSLPKVLGAANALNIPFTKVVATLGKLTDAGIEATIAGTSFRKILISAARQGINYEKALDKVRNATDKLRVADEVFGTRAAISAVLIAANTEKLDLLDEALQRAQGTSKEMADKELDTLSGALDLLKSAWAGVILRENEAHGIGERLKIGIRSLAQNIDKIVDFLKKAIKAWIIYKVTLIAISLASRLYIASVVALRVAKIALAGGIGKATRAMQLFNIASKANPLGILISLLAGAVALFIAFGEGANSAARAQRNLNKAVKEAKKSAENQKEISDKRIQDEIDGIRKRTRLAVAEAKTEKEVFIIREKAIKDTIKLLKDEQEVVRSRIIAYANQSIQYAKGSAIRLKFNTLIKEESKLYDTLGEKIKSLITDNKELIKEDAFEKVGDAVRGSIGYFQDQISELKKLQKNTAVTQKKYSEFQTQIDALTGSIGLLNGAYAKWLDTTSKIKDISFKDAFPDPEEIGDFGFVDLDFLDDEFHEDFIPDDELTKISFDRKIGYAVEFYEGLTDLASTYADRNLQQIENEENAVKEKYATLLDNDKLSLEQRAALEAERDRKLNELEKKRRVEERKKAVLNKAFRAGEVLANTAVAITKTLAETGFFGIPLTAIVAAIGLAQLAAILSQPIPQFREGHLSGTHEGMAVINDAIGGNYQEIVERKSGRLEVFGGRKTIIGMKKGDKVHKAGTYSPNDSIINSAMALSVIGQNGHITDKDVTITINDQISKEIAKGFRGLKPHKPKEIDYARFTREMRLQIRANKI